jgi:multiple sugar transport system substrate-binding protein
MRMKKIWAFLTGAVIFSVLVTGCSESGKMAASDSEKDNKGHDKVPFSWK